MACASKAFHTLLLLLVVCACARRSGAEAGRCASFPFCRCDDTKPSSSPFKLSSLGFASTTGDGVSVSLILSAQAPNNPNSQCAQVLQNEGMHKLTLHTAPQCIGHVKVYINGQHCSSCKAQQPPNKACAGRAYIPVRFRPGAYVFPVDGLQHNITLVGSGPCNTSSQLLIGSLNNFRAAFFNHGRNSKKLLCCPKFKASTPQPGPVCWYADKDRQACIIGFSKEECDEQRDVFASPQQCCDSAIAKAWPRPGGVCAPQQCWVANVVNSTCEPAHGQQCTIPGTATSSNLPLCCEVLYRQLMELGLPLPTQGTCRKHLNPSPPAPSSPAQPTQPTKPACWYADWALQACLIGFSEEECDAQRAKTTDVFTDKVDCCSTLAPAWNNTTLKRQGICLLEDSQNTCYVPDVSLGGCYEQTMTDKGVGCSGPDFLDYFPTTRQCCDYLFGKGFTKLKGVCAPEQCWVADVQDADCKQAAGDGCAVPGAAIATTLPLCCEALYSQLGFLGLPLPNFGTCKKTPNRA